MLSVDCTYFLFSSYRHHRDLHSFPTRRSSDLRGNGRDATALESLGDFKRFPAWMWRNADIVDLIGWLRNYNEKQRCQRCATSDRKSTRLNSSHEWISYAVFCLKKKKKKKKNHI